MAKKKKSFKTWRALLQHLDKMEERARERANATAHILSDDELQVWAASRGVEVATRTKSCRK